jgi:release factor glutamine methyltransferase
MLTIKAALRLLSRIDARVLLQHVLQVSHAWLITHEDVTLNSAQEAQYLVLVAKRKKGEPIAYLVGTREFYGLDFAIGPGVLIPRPDTELLVELALQYLPLNGMLLDLGTGSGAIAISIAKNRPDVTVVAVDCSFEALHFARLNAHTHGVVIAFYQGHWFDALPMNLRFDLIVSNPPYIAKADAHLSQGDLRFEPIMALTDGSEDGLADIRHIVNYAKPYLNSQGRLLLEHGYNQAEACRLLLQKANFTTIFSAKDLTSIERVSGGTIVMSTL